MRSVKGLLEMLVLGQARRALFERHRITSSRSPFQAIIDNPSVEKRNGMGVIQPFFGY